ncbi:hypothetical protein [Tenacibaculum jejuense]|uniref:Uncharacterized protein n=1 Tax=Tenacibaculum jejuense TaxID=584609 RepID=A0A238U4R6_9FLAO|nr:hypothetical protein [Tenacibaculum jejuense]SNR14191.1 membrane protein of unknown function [Tenacibaculum jejuense]
MIDIDKTIDSLNLLKVREAGNINYQNIFLVGVALGAKLFLIDLERNWIPIELILAIIIIVTIIITLIYRKFYSNKLGLIWSSFHNLSIGIVAVYAFMLSNDILSNEPTITKKYKVSEMRLVHDTSKKIGISSNLKPKIIVEIDNIDREFKLHRSRSKYATHTRKVNIGIKKGFWGYDIVEKLKLDNEE